MATPFNYTPGPFDKYIGVMTESEFERLENATILGAQPKFSTLEILNFETRLQARKENENLLYRTAQRNNDGIKAETEKNMELAIKLYEENIAEGYHATHSYQRLMILYRRAKQYESELRVIDRMKEVFGCDRVIQEKLESRKVKALSLLSKRQVS